MSQAQHRGGRLSLASVVPHLYTAEDITSPHFWGNLDPRTQIRSLEGHHRPVIKVAEAGLPGSCGSRFLLLWWVKEETRQQQLRTNGTWRQLQSSLHSRETLHLGEASGREAWEGHLTSSHTMVPCKTGRPQSLSPKIPPDCGTGPNPPILLSTVVIHWTFTGLAQCPGRAA